ncbi:MAG: hypothetical protein LBF72_03800, partial [Holosporales bacterium]|nr:hypothetical protein [Holosporales bacterium]
MEDDMMRGILGLFIGIGLAFANCATVSASRASKGQPAEERRVAPPVVGGQLVVHRGEGILEGLESLVVALQAGGDALYNKAAWEGVKRLEQE